jgi:Mg-chelatase subunit ChlD
VAKIYLVLVGIVLSVCGILASAQSEPAPSASSLLVNVLDRNGDAVRDLSKDNFRVRVNGRPAALLQASYSLAPRRIVVLLDMSGSMAGEPDHKKWWIAREALEDLLAETPSNVSIALLTFSDQVHDVFEFSQNRTSMAAWLKERPGKKGDDRVHGRTAIFDALLAATKMLGSARPGDAIYVITDGGDNSSHILATKIRKLLLQSGIRLFVFLFAEQQWPGEMQSGTDSLMEMARATGGFVFGISARHSGVDFVPSWSFAFDDDNRTLEKVKIYTRALNVQVNGFYTLRFDSPVPLGKARKVSVDLVDGTGRPRKDVAFTYSTLLPPQPK